MRSASEKAIAALLKLPAVPSLTDSLTDLSQTEWRTVLARLRRARLLAREDPQNPGHRDWAASFNQCERNPAGVERLASELIELSTRYHFAHWLPEAANLPRLGAAMPETPRKAFRRLSKA